MIVTYQGAGAFKISQGDLTLALNPQAKISADVTLFTTDKSPAYAEASAGKAGFVIDGPGEYEVKGADIMGYPSPSGAVYYVKLEDAKLVFLGGLAEKELPADTMAELRSADIMFVPVGGKPYLDSDDAASLIKKLEPKVVIPCFYKTPGLKRKADDVKDFEKAFGQKAEPQEKLTIKAKDMTWEGIKLVVLKV